MSLPIFDTHVHYTDEAFKEDRDELLASLPSCGVRYAVIPGCDVESSREALRLADRYGYLYAAVGIHPEEAGIAEDADLETVRALLSHPKAVAVGEIGMDYHYGRETAEKQKELFSAQLSLARETGKKVIVHERDAWEDTVACVLRYPEVKGVFHCFGGSAEGAAFLIERGWMISFTGVITFRNARRPLEALRAVPLDRLMIETDAPYMSPEPFRGKRNDSTRLISVIEKIAEIKEETPERIAEITLENACRFYGIS